jgi:ribosomal protein S18 acetylase RimI-like enzyme
MSSEAQKRSLSPHNIVFSKQLLIPPLLGPKPVEMQRIYVLPDFISKGIGPALMERGLAEARARGFETVWLGVWENNVRALKYPLHS